MFQQSFSPYHFPFLDLYASALFDYHPSFGIPKPVTITTAMILFSLFFDGARSFIGSFSSILAQHLANRLLPIRADCGRCSHSTAGIHIANGSVNALHCTSCGFKNRQFTNATPRTVRNNSAILAAHIARPYWGKPDGEGRAFKPTFDVDVVHGNNEDLVATLHVRRFRDGSILYAKDVQFSAVGARARHRIQIPVPLDTLTEEVFAVDVLLQNAWGDELHRVRRLSNAVPLR